MKAAVKEKLGGVPLTPRHEVTSGGQDHQHDVHKIHVHELHMIIYVRTYFMLQYKTLFQMNFRDIQNRYLHIWPY